MEEQEFCPRITRMHTDGRKGKLFSNCSGQNFLIQQPEIQSKIWIPDQELKKFGNYSTDHLSSSFLSPPLDSSVRWNDSFDQGYC
jgi:hypothetical protein